MLIKNDKIVVFRILVVLLVFITFTLSTCRVVFSENNIEPNESKALMDRIIPLHQKDYHLPGAVVVLVKDGEIVLSEGYGYADIEKERLVSVDETLFRVGSVSKLFVWTSVMQLVEQGKIDLYEDINVYLTKFKIPDKLGKPITMLNLMNHNAGFEERAIGESVGSPDDIKPLDQYLIEHMPERVRPPGVFAAYSNYGASFAGYVVSQVSGMAYEEYIQQNIFDLLDMKHSTFMQPLPADLQQNMAVGYSYKNGDYIPHDFEWKQSSPAGAMSATGGDMAKFMISMLNKGSFQGERILEESTAIKMQERSFTNDSRVNGIAHGFMESSMNGQHMILHGGDIFQFHTSLVLLPEENVGLYIAFNGAGGMEAVNNVITEFMDHYYSNDKRPPSASKYLDEDVSKYEGTYMPLRREYTTIGKLVGLMQSITVKQSAPHRIKVSLGFPAQITANYVQVGEDRFSSEDVPSLIYGDIVFRADSKGNVNYQFQENNPASSYLKLPWYAEPGITIAILICSLMVFLFILISTPFSIWLKHRRKYKVRKMEDRAFIISRLVSLSSLIFITGFILMFSKQEIVFGLPKWSMIIFILPYIIGLLVLCMASFAVIAWKKKYWTLAGRIYYTFITLISFSFVWWMYYWNLWVMKV